MALNGFVRNFLRKFWTELPGFLRLLLSVELTDPEDVLARYLLHKSHVKPFFQAFMPPPDLELSTFHINALSEAAILQLGHTVLAETTRVNAKLYGRADLKVEVVRAQKLKAFRDDDPERHTIVTGWPEKSAFKSLAQELAAKADLKLLDAPIER